MYKDRNIYMRLDSRSDFAVKLLAFGGEGVGCAGVFYGIVRLFGEGGFRFLRRNALFGVLTGQGVALHYPFEPHFGRCVHARRYIA